MKLYNSLTHQIETFTPLHDNQVGMYTCGPTVYAQAHIGNMRTYVLADILVRTLKLLGYQVNHVMNITDIDDKMILIADEQGISLSELADKFETIFFNDLGRLNIEFANTYARATEHFPEMKQLLNTLVEKGYAYEKNGDVYFDISKFKNYGRLSQLDKREIKPGARVATDKYTKDDVSDFALWKVDEVTKRHQHDLTRGGGRPGWHLECSAMSMKYLGTTLDIHVGGVDLLFPHHENEIAQSEAATEKPFARFFVHGEFLLVDNQKMAKSDNNFYTVDDIAEAGIDPVAYRYLVLSAHYRSKLNFTWDSLKAAAKGLASIRQLAYREDQLTPALKQQALEAGKQALEDDLNTPKLLSILHQANSYALWQAFEPVLGLGLAAADIPQKVLNLADARQEAKKAKDYTKADQLRTEIHQLGYEVEDKPEASQLVPRSLDKT